MRDVADWQRWANVGIQEQLCEKMEAVTALDDPEEIAKQVRELQQQWRQAADVPRAQGEALWRRFKAAHDEAWKRCESHFAAQAEARAENLAKKVALCERAEGYGGQQQPRHLAGDSALSRPDGCLAPIGPAGGVRGDEPE